MANAAVADEPPLLLLCRPAPRTAVVDPGHAETAGHPSTLFPAGHPVELRFARPSDTASLLLAPAVFASPPPSQIYALWPPSSFSHCWPPACCHALADSRTRGTVATHSARPYCYCWTPACRHSAGPHTAGTAAGPPRSDTARTGPSVRASLTRTPAGSHTPHSPVLCYITH